MARNLMSILQREGPVGRVLVFAANNHVRKSPRESDLGVYLNDLLGKQMIVIGSFCNKGAVGRLGGETRPIPPSPSLTLNSAFMDGVRKPLFLLDLDSVPREGPLADWLANGKPVWNYRFEGNPARSFDALLVIDTISPLRPLK